MPEHDFIVLPDSNTLVSRQPVKVNKDKENPGAASIQGDPLCQISSRLGDRSSANVHTSTLNRATISKPALATNALLRLQRQYGNRYVRRLIDIVRKDESNAEVVPEAIQSAHGSGQAFEGSVRTKMESVFGTDCINVRVHTGSDAIQMNRNVGAQAFTHGSDTHGPDIYCGSGHSPTNLELTTHELTHVVQKTGKVPLQTKCQEQPVAPLALRQRSNRVVLRAPKASTPCPMCAANQEEMVQRQAYQKGAVPSERGKGPLNLLSTVQRKETLEDEQKEGQLEATGFLYQDILEKQISAIDTVYEAQKKAPEPAWDEMLVKYAVSKLLDQAVEGVGKIPAVGDVIKGVVGVMSKALEKSLHKAVEQRLGPALPEKNPALAFFIPLHDSLIDAKHTAQQTFMTDAKPTLKTNGTLEDARKIHAALSAQFVDVSANFWKQVVDRWMLYISGARYGVDDKGNTNMVKAKSDMEGGALGHGPTGVLFVATFLDGDNKNPTNPKLKIGWFDTFGLGADMWELITKQNRTVKDFNTDVKIFGPAGNYEYWMGNSGRKMWENLAYMRISRNPSGKLWDDSPETGKAWLELVGYGEPSKVSDAWTRDRFMVNEAMHLKGMQKIFDLIANEPVDKKRLKKS